MKEGIGSYLRVCTFFLQTKSYIFALRKQSHVGHTDKYQ